MKALLLLNLIVPLVMLLVSFQLRKYPVSDMQSHTGYNTPTSRRSKVHWDYAQKIAPDIFQHFGKIFLIVEILLCVTWFALDINVNIAVIIGTIIGFCGLFLGFWKTEKSIKDNCPQ